MKWWWQGAGAPERGLFCPSVCGVEWGFRRLFFRGVWNRNKKRLQHLTEGEDPGIVGGCRPKGDALLLIDNRCGKNGCARRPDEPTPGVVSGKVMTQTNVIRTRCRTLSTSDSVGQQFGRAN